MIKSLNILQKSGESIMMHMYEVILKMIDKHGPVSIADICNKINENPLFILEKDKPVQAAQIKSAIRHKSELFTCENDVVSLLPDKEFISFVFNAGASKGPWVKVNVDFIKNIFTYFEWKAATEHRDSNETIEDEMFPGNVTEFKQVLYRLQIWNWNRSYEQEGIVLDGINWSLYLETKAKVYQMEGYQQFPDHWQRLCKALTELTGKKIFHSFMS